MILNSDETNPRQWICIHLQMNAILEQINK